ncbi:MAG: YhcH/YjgK/YiaL family protein [Dysgonamonadaceae bacterium]|jgi:YhcH/YjgK/YiaL family protein|nr:YhcH/YjgK/YiaL family protein [Dysgonamonadaceae bacterium]
MIIDSLKNSAQYEQLNPYFRQAFDYIKSLDFSKIEPDKVVLKDDDLIVNINASKLKSSIDAKLEVHNKYIDIQVPVSCEETFGWKQRCECKDVAVPFDPEKDIEFYGDSPTTYFTLCPGEFVIFFPEDGHAPCVGEGDIKKIIVKVIVK